MSNTSFNQIFKLPLLIEHYREHRALNYTVTFFEFLAMHYGGNDNDPRDDAKDHSLPFKQFDQFVQLSAFPIGNRIQESRITLPAISYPYPPLRDRLTEDPFNGSSFKPPPIHSRLLRSIPAFPDSTTRCGKYPQIDTNSIPAFRFSEQIVHPPTLL